MFRVGRKLHCIKSDKVLHAEVDEDNIQAKTSTGLSLLHSYISNIIKVVCDDIRMIVTVIRGGDMVAVSRGALL